MAVRIRLKRLGRTHRPYFRICAMDARTARNGRVIEELGTYDPMVKETDARVTLNSERVDYWLSVGAKPTDKVGVLIKKYGTGGTHLEAQAEAIARLNQQKATPFVPPPPKKVEPKEEPKAEETATEETPTDEAAPEEPVAETTEDTADEASSEEAKTEESNEDEGGLDAAIQE